MSFPKKIIPLDLEDSASVPHIESLQLGP